MKKNHSFFIFSLTICIIINSCGQSNNINKALVLDHGWHFKLGDQKEWALQSTDDSKWDTAAVGRLSAGKPFENYNGYGWYRVKFHLPQSWIENSVSSFPDSIKFYFGAIDDCDEVYLNGSLIGANNKNLPYGYQPDSSFTSAKGLWNVPRKYMLSIKDKRIQLEKDNVIAIRVFDQYGDGGIYSEVPQISKYGLEEYVSIDLNNFYKVNENEYVNREITVRNKSLHVLVNGDLDIVARNAENEKTVYQNQYVIQLNPGEIKTVFVKLPISTDPLKLYLSVNDHNFHQSMSVQDSIPYVLTP